MRGNKIILKMLSSSKKQFTEWDEAIFLAAFQIFENAITKEPNILNKKRYSPEENKTQELLFEKVKKAKELFKWWITHKKRYSKEISDKKRMTFDDYDYRFQSGLIQKEKMIELINVLDILWD